MSARLHTVYIAPDEAHFQPKINDIYLFLHENVCCVYSLEAPHRGASNEYTQHMFSWRNKKNISLIRPLIWSDYAKTKADLGFGSPHIALSPCSCVVTETDL